MEKEIEIVKETQIGIDIQRMYVCLYLVTTALVVFLLRFDLRDALGIAI